MSLSDVLFFLIPASIAEAAAVISNGAKMFFAKETVTFTNGSANLINKDPYNPPEWIILENWALESFMSVNILVLNAFLSFIFCLVVNNNSWGKLFPLNVFKPIFRVVPVLFLPAVFSFFSWVSVNFTFNLLY